MKNRFFRNPLCLIIILLVTLSMAACGSKTETATIPMDSFSESISEVGIWGASSSLKKHYKAAQKEGDIGTITITLENGDTQEFYTSPWWVDMFRQRLTADTVVIAGNTGDYYTSSFHCHKCGFGYSLNYEIGVQPFTTTVKCDCSGHNHFFGMQKIITISVIPIS